MNASVAFVEPRNPDERVEGNPPIIIILASAVRDGSVFVVAGGKALRRKVRVARTTAEGEQIDSGLIGGEDLIVNPPANLTQRQKIHEEGQTP